MWYIYTVDYYSAIKKNEFANDIKKLSGIVTFWSNELSAPLDVSKGYEALCPEVVEDYGFL